ncbi:MAG TPA: PilZ domain-containing protein [Gaiellales bacterium]|nr:PilZ domain-containing protein [Gaiellales bacterium]
MQTLAPDVALERLFESGQAMLASDRHTVEVTALAIVRDTVAGIAPRLEVAEGMRLSGRITAADGEPWLITLEVASTGIRSTTLADVRLRVHTIEPHPRRRRFPRVPAGGDAHAVAVNCLDIADGLRIDVSLRDISLQGIGFTTDARLSAGDRIEVHIRRLSETVTADVRVVLVRAALHGRRRVGCSILHVEEEDAARLARMAAVDAAPAAASAIDLASLRVGSDPAPSGWRQRLPRAR